MLTLELTETTVIDGLIINSETGEVIGNEKPEFIVTDIPSMEWVMQKRLNAAADLAAIALKEKAILDNLAAEKRRAQARIDWLDSWFGPQIENFARRELEGKKTKTLNCAFGAASFRKVPGGPRVSDPEKALDWAKAKCPEAVKVVESFLITKVPAEQKADLAQMPCVAAADFGFEIVPDSEVFKLDSKVKA